MAPPYCAFLESRLLVLEINPAHKRREILSAVLVPGEWRRLHFADGADSRRAELVDEPRVFQRRRPDHDRAQPRTNLQDGRREVWRQRLDENHTVQTRTLEHRVGL